MFFDHHLSVGVVLCGFGRKKETYEQNSAKNLWFNLNQHEIKSVSQLIKKNMSTSTAIIKGRRNKRPVFSLFVFLNRTFQNIFWCFHREEICCGPYFSNVHFARIKGRFLFLVSFFCRFFQKKPGLLFRRLRYLWSIRFTPFCLKSGLGRQKTKSKK